ncbi:hypothetical protein NQ317_007199 [Molorchus minor]|uniref:Calpain catalytic domain-containing protein n=1 Tax=Molorchus minor TaxID=1323400 RepID=A0ABQ9JP55_9CUCU|nr:hypothetical protein NQ317_007199 [Molorchus minor]
MNLKLGMENSTVLEGETSDGLYTRHAYSITCVTEVRDKEGNNAYRLVRIRNPWGVCEWKVHRAWQKRYTNPKWIKAAVKRGKKEARSFIPTRSLPEQFNFRAQKRNVPKNTNNVIAVESLQLVSTKTPICLHYMQGIIGFVKGSSDLLEKDYRWENVLMALVDEAMDNIFDFLEENSEEFQSSLTKLTELLGENPPNSCIYLDSKARDFISSATWDLIEEDTKQQMLRIKDDGEFWMQFEDFISNYTMLEFCHPNPASLRTAQKEMQHWKSFMIDGAWVAKVTSGGLPNKRGNYDPETGRLDASFFDVRKPIYSRHLETAKQITGHVDLPNGNYCIMPFTDNTNINCEFLLRVYSEVPFNVVNL